MTEETQKALINSLADHSERVLSEGTKKHAQISPILQSVLHPRCFLNPISIVEERRRRGVPKEPFRWLPRNARRVPPPRSAQGV